MFYTNESEETENTDNLDNDQEEDTSNDESQDNADDGNEADDDQSDDKVEGKTVSLKKHLKLKKELKKAKEGKGESNTEGMTPEELADWRQERKERKAEKFDKAFSEEFNKFTSDYPELKDKKEQIKELSKTEKYKDNTLEEIAVDVFGGFIDRRTSEASSSAGGDNEEGNIDVDFDNITPEQEDKILADPKAKAKYYKYLDSRG